MLQRPGIFCFIFVCLTSPVFAQPTAEGFHYVTTDAQIEYDPASGLGDAEVSVRIQEVQSSGLYNSVLGWSMSVSHDPTYLVATSIDQGAFTSTLNSGVGPEVWLVTTYADGFTIECLYSFLANTTCVYEVVKEVAVATYATIPSALVGDTDGETVDLSFHGMLGSPVIGNGVMTLGPPQPPAAFSPGTVDLVAQSPSFLRGDADGSGAVSAIADGVMVLAYLFNQSSLSCLDAADVNDDGVINLTDSVLIFGWGFQSGPAPAVPFPTCGPDPTAVDALSCDVSNC